MLEQNRASFFSNITTLATHTTHFIGREWVFQAINDWLADTRGARFFLLTGEPGCGKTAIASRLTQFSLGTAPRLVVECIMQIATGKMSSFQSQFV
ncbi:MAG TPA: ATP-binding protein [Ktedonobacteraceae bacterium]|jgi:ATP-dependent Clp protease ATP-binding subunit ClpA|nr:ATP-binding protein [Ktedonobacteraceae bacterium]